MRFEVSQTPTHAGTSEMLDADRVYIQLQTALVTGARKRMELRQGTIAWATILMPNGKRKRRPVVIATPTGSISSVSKIRVVGISHSFRSDDPDVVPLAWRQDGNIYT